MRIERGGSPLAAQSNTQPGVIGFAFLFDIAVPGAPRRGFALMDQGPCADWKETQRRALSKTVQRRQFSQMRARSPALHRLERKFIWMSGWARTALHSGCASAAGQAGVSSSVNRRGVGDCQPALRMRAARSVNASNSEAHSAAPSAPFGSSGLARAILRARSAQALNAALEHFALACASPASRSGNTRFASARRQAGSRVNG